VNRSSTVTLSTKTWEGDYRTILSAEGIRDLFGPLGDAGGRQVVLNRINDPEEAEGLAGRLVGAGTIDRFVWAEDLWPRIARELGIPPGWFGAAWPYSVPEICELATARTDFVLHVAGDVRFAAPKGWLERAVRAFDDPGVSIVTATPPAGRQWVSERGKAIGDGWTQTRLFSDQLFMARRAELLAGSVMKSEHPASARYPKPGGALTFEARVGAWIALRERTTLVDLDTSYLHPVSGREGDSYQRKPYVPSADAHPAPSMGSHYPPARSVRATGLVFSKGRSSSVGAAVASLGWCERVIALDLLGSQDAQAAALRAGAQVVEWNGVAELGVARRQVVADLSGWVVELGGNQVCSAALARAIAARTGDADTSGLEANSLSWIGSRRPPRRNGRSQWHLVAYRSDRITFGQPLNGYPLILSGSIVKLRPSAGSFIMTLEAADLRSFVDEVNDRSSWRAENLVLERGPVVRMPLLRFVRSYLGGRWRYGRRGADVALLEAFEDWLMIEKWRDQISGGRVAAEAIFEQEAGLELEGSTGRDSGGSSRGERLRGAGRGRLIDAMLRLGRARRDS
jgi:hypothetical protein